MNPYLSGLNLKQLTGKRHTLENNIKTTKWIECFGKLLNARNVNPEKNKMKLLMIQKILIK